MRAILARLPRAILALPHAVRIPAHDDGYDGAAAAVIWRGRGHSSGAAANMADGDHQDGRRHARRRHEAQQSGAQGRRGAIRWSSVL